jgi:NitT/TauT family transport system substrate-binding protein
VRVGSLGSLGDSGATIGIEKGYYAEQGLDLELIRFDSVAQMIAPLSAGQLDVANGSVTAGLFNAIGRGIGLKCVAGTSHSPPGHGVNAFVVRSQIADQISTAADLRGRKVAVAARGVSPETELSKLLEQAGLSMGDVEEVLLGFPDMVTAMGAGTIDMAILPEPFPTQMQTLNVGKVWKRTDEILPYHQTGCLLFSPQFLQNRAAAQGYVTAFLRAVRDFDDAFVKNDAQKRSEVIPILIKNTALKDSALYEKMVFYEMPPDGHENLDSLKVDQDFFVASGQQQSPADLTQLIDTSFTEAALRDLGPYR